MHTYTRLELRACGWFCVLRRCIISWHTAACKGRHVLITRWGWVTHICVSKLTSIGSDNGLSPGRRQAIIWSKADLLSIEPWGTKFSDILIEIQTFPLKKNLFEICCLRRGSHFGFTSLSPTTRYYYKFSGEISRDVAALRELIQYPVQ